MSNRFNFLIASLNDDDDDNDVNNESVFPEHAHNTTHRICIEDARLIAKASYYTKRTMWEALEIKRWTNTLKNIMG